MQIILFSRGKPPKMLSCDLEGAEEEGSVERDGLDVGFVCFTALTVKKIN